MSKIIPLPHNLSAVVDDTDFDWLMQWNWRSSNGYAKRNLTKTVNDKERYMHRLILNAAKGECVDHINGNRLDNRRCNLRITNATGNAQNSSRRSTNTTGYKGVIFTKGKWKSQIKVNGRFVSLGYSPTAIEAALIYDTAARICFGEFCRINFPDIESTEAQIQHVHSQLHWKDRQTSKYLGVSWKKSHNSWYVRIRHNSKRISLGYFKDEREAAKTYNEYAIMHNIDTKLNDI